MYKDNSNNSLPHTSTHTPHLHTHPTPPTHPRLLMNVSKKNLEKTITQSILVGLLLLCIASTTIMNLAIMFMGPLWAFMDLRWDL